MRSSYTKHWCHIKEQGTLLGMRITLWSVRLLGSKITSCFVMPVMMYYYLLCKDARNASKKYLSHMKNYGVKKKFSSFKHFVSFGQSIVDKVQLWSHGIQEDAVSVPNKALLLETLNQKKGGIFFTAHMGNIDVARIFSEKADGVKINALVFNRHVKHFTYILKKINKKFDLNVIHLEEVTLDLAVELKERCDEGEFFVIAAARISATNPSRVLKVPFFDTEIYLPEGPFLLAGLLQCEGYYMLSMKEPKGGYTVYFEKCFDAIDIRKVHRQKSLEEASKHYGMFLESLCIKYPYQWFNFFDIFELPKELSHEKK